MSSILDRYFTKKLKKYIDRVLSNWNVEHKYIGYNNYVNLVIKKPTFNDNQYEVAFSFFKEDAFSILCRQKELEEYIGNQVKIYFDSLKED